MENIALLMMLLGLISRVIFSVYRLAVAGRHPDAGAVYAQLRIAKSVRQSQQ